MQAVLQIVNRTVRLPGTRSLFANREYIRAPKLPLSDREIRTCLYRGKLNDLLKGLAEFEEFKRCVPQQGIEARMTDRLLVIRFLAFYEQKVSKVQRG